MPVVCAHALRVSDWRQFHWMPPVTMVTRGIDRVIMSAFMDCTLLYYYIIIDWKYMNTLSLSHTHTPARNAHTQRVKYLCIDDMNHPIEFIVVVTTTTQFIHKCIVNDLRCRWVLAVLDQLASRMASSIIGEIIWVLIDTVEYLPIDALPIGAAHNIQWTTGK